MKEKGPGETTHVICIFYFIVFLITKKHQFDVYNILDVITVTKVQYG